MRLAGKREKSVRTGARLRGKAQLSVAAGIAATGLAALVATAPAQAATSAQAVSHDVWQTAYSTHGGTSKEFDAITAPARNDAWAVADTNAPNKIVTPVFAHWNGKTWSSVAIKAAAGLDFGGVHPAYSTSPSNVWFFGENQKTHAIEALVYNGKRWHIQPLQSDFAVPLAVLGPKDVWGESVKSFDGETGSSTVVTHWNGRTWSDLTIQGIAPTASSAGGHAWIMTVDAAPTAVSEEAPAGPPIVYRTAGAALNKVGVPGHATIIQDQSGIAAAPDGRLWILTNSSSFTGTVYSGSGNKWVSSVIPADDMVTAVSTLSYDGKNGFWDGPYGHWTRSKMTDTGNAVAKQLAAAFWTAGVAVPIPGTDSAWSAGYVPQTAKSTSTNAVIAVYGPLP
jgi:hypothetical protein